MDGCYDCSLSLWRVIQALHNKGNPYSLIIEQCVAGQESQQLLYIYIAIYSI